MSVRNERRRRLLADEALAADAEASEPTLRLAGAKAAETLGDSAYAVTVGNELARRLIDLVPQSGLTVSLLLVAGGSIVALLSALDVWSSALTPGEAGNQSDVLQLAGPQGVGRWFTSLLAAACAPLAWVIYRLRRHRVDDYHGRYRVWLWMALAALGMSLFEGTGLGGLARFACQSLSARGGLDAAVVWPAAVATLAIALNLRLLVEIRRCRPALTTWTLAGLSLAGMVVVEHGWAEPLGVTIPAVTAGILWLVAHVLLAATLVLYARDVRIQIEGPPKSKSKRKRSVKPAKPADDDAAAPQAKPRPALQIRTDLDPIEPAAAATKSASATTRGAHPAASQETQPRLSRAERRRAQRETRMAG